MENPIELVERLYREVGPELLGYFRRQPTLAGAAEDLLQDTFVRAFRRCDRLESSASQRAYLFGIARHLSVDALRRLRPLEEIGPEAAPSPPEDGRLEAMRQAIEALPPAHRETLLLKLQHGLTYDEIAAVLGIPVGTVRSRLHHAVRLLREKLRTDEETQ